MISIVLPVYNGERYLADSINSILNQTYKDFELIIVNDCSTDSSLEIIEEFARTDPRIIIIYNEQNQKLPRSLNIGFSHCHGEYYTWTSDDNLMLPDFCEAMITKLQNSNADLVFSRCGIVDSSGSRIGKTELYDDLDEIYCNNIVLASFMYRRKVHDALNGYDTNKFLVEDYDFWLRAYRQFRFAYIPDILYEIRFHGDNLGTKYFEDVKLRKIELLKDNLAYIDKELIKNSIYKEISNCYFDASNFYVSKISKNSIYNKIVIGRGKDFIKKLFHKK